MTPNLIHANAVVAAHQFNPSVVSQLWLVDHGIVLREEFEAGKGSVFSDMMVNVASEKLTMLVTPDQVQFSPTQPPPNEDGIVENRLGRLVRTLPHTPFSACGLNFTWLLEDDDVIQVAKCLFFIPDSPLHHAFDVENSRFGGYMSKPALGGRLKLDIKPFSLRIPNGESTERLQFAFNFHVDVPQASSGVEAVVAHLANWNQAYEMTREIMQVLESEVVK
ncbi:MAG: hypothetical protein K9M08_07620 [Pirellula sp.]|nr:hypothetical protein [Pirellula sp.]